MNHSFRTMLAAFGLLCVFCAPDAVFAQKSLRKILRVPSGVTAISRGELAKLEREIRAAEKAARTPVSGKIVYPFKYKQVFKEASVPSFSPAKGVLPAPFSAPGLAVSLRADLPYSFPGKETVDAVIFDLDGTLLDSLSAWEHSGTNFLRTQGITPPEGMDEELVQLSLLDGARLIKERFNLPQEPEEILRLTLEPVRRHYFEDITFKPGVLETLFYLRSQGVKMCVATASHRDFAVAALERLGVLDMFEFVITCDEVGVGKRSPAVYEEALRRMGTDKTRTLVAEDAWYALDTARRAGFLTAGVADSHTSVRDSFRLRRDADYFIEHFRNGVTKKPDFK